MRSLAIFAIVVSVGATAHAADVGPLIAQIKSVGAEGAGSAPAAAAWAQLSKQDVSAVMPIMAALNDASPRAANWLRSALDAIVERERAAKRPLPDRDLEAFLANTKHNGQARRLAYELMKLSDSTAEKRLLPTFMNDPSLEMRFEAVAQAFDVAKALPKESPEAKATLKKLVLTSRDVDQVETIAKELEGRGDPVDFLALYGFITQWNLCSAFDNTGGKGFATPYPPEKKVDLHSVVPGKGGKEAKWFGHVTPDKMGAVDLNKAIGKEKNAVAYAHAVVESPADQPVEIRVASATAVKIFVNGKEVLDRESYHQSFTVDSHIAPARFNKGKNSILLKVCQNDQKEPWAQDWKFQVRVSDSLGSPVAVKVEPVVVNEGAGS